MIKGMAKFEECPLQQHSQCQKRPRSYKGPLRVVRLCILGIALPTALISVPLYLRYHVYANQLYPFAVSDMRLLDRHISTVWCQRQLVSVNHNATFNAFLMSEQPNVAPTQKTVSMERDLLLEDDMKEYWGFYLLAGSTVTVSTCVRWPGASLIVIRGHKHLHECAYIGDDSSEELEEILEAIREGVYVNTSDTSESDALANAPQLMKRHRPDVRFHHPLHGNSTHNHSIHYEEVDVSEVTDSKLMKVLLDSLSKKTGKMDQQRKDLMNKFGGKSGGNRNSGTENSALPNCTHHSGGSVNQQLENVNSLGVRDQLRKLHRSEENRNNNNHTNSEDLVPQEYKLMSDSEELLREVSQNLNNLDEKQFKVSGTQEGVPTPSSYNKYINRENLAPQKSNLPSSSEGRVSQDLKTEQKVNETKVVDANPNNASSENLTSSEELFRELSQKLDTLGERQLKVLQKLNNRLAKNPTADGQQVDTANHKINLRQLQRQKRDLIISTAVANDLTVDDEKGNAAIEEGFTSDGIADHRGSFNETTMNDRSNSEFWSSFSSSEEALLNCAGLILNLPLTPHPRCEMGQPEERLNDASLANTVTYLVPRDGYYFFVFNSENEVQVNYIRVRFQLNKTMYDVSHPVSSCANTTEPCALDLRFFSGERTVMEVPVTANDSLWNEEFVVVSECQPRTMVYVCCVLSVPILIILFAFQ